MVAPGALETDRLRRFATAHAKERGVSVDTVLDEYRSHSPLGRMTTVDQVSWAVVQLLAPEAVALHGPTCLIAAVDPAPSSVLSLEPRTDRGEPRTQVGFVDEPRFNSECASETS